MRKVNTIVILLAVMLVFTACGNESVNEVNNGNIGSVGGADNDGAVVKETVLQEEEVFENPNYVRYVESSDIVRDTSELGENYKKYYSKYIDYIAPNGKPIRIVAADKVSDEQMLKAYNVLSFYLSDTEHYNKDKIANSMADKGTVLNMPNGADGDGSTPDEALWGQPLYQMEVQVAGSKWYQENDYEHRDASYEEIFHMVHDMGIGTTQNPAANPALAEKIKLGMERALPKDKADWGKKGVWGLESREWLLELSKEGSLEQEYIVSGIDSFYGLWEAYTESDKGMWGMYVPKRRMGVKIKDEVAYNIITSFLGDYLTYMERIAPEFESTFKMNLDKTQAYTFKSQYLQNARLTGDKNSSLEGNALDNILLGNKGNNTLDGKDGEDVVQFSGKSIEYKISKQGDNIMVKDTKDRDGEDTLINIEILRFTDRDIKDSEI